jgi:hypothetical protein
VPQIEARRESHWVRSTRTSPTPTLMMTGFDPSA